jgi:hydrogenase large subunit
LICGANYIQSHILHFYHLAALDYVDVTKVAMYDGKDSGLNSVKTFITSRNISDAGALAPFFPRYEGDYHGCLMKQISLLSVIILMLIKIRKLAHEMSAIFSGKMPHNVAIVPGGVTEIPTVDKITNFLWKLNAIRDFIDHSYIPDLLMIGSAYPDYFRLGRGCGNLLSYGAFDLDCSEKDLSKRERLFKQGIGSWPDMKLMAVDPSKITEQVTYSWYKDKPAQYPYQATTEVDRNKDGAYTWIKAPRYDGKVYEVGPLARMVINYLSGDIVVKQAVDNVLKTAGVGMEELFSVLGRHIARGLECKIIADNMAKWLLELKPGDPTCIGYQNPEEGEGMGLHDGPRGALGHWLLVKGAKIANYQCVVPTTWNASPRDESNQPGSMEQALMGTMIKDEANPFEIGRIVRSYDPCLACAIHMIDSRGNEINSYRIT